MAKCKSDFLKAAAEGDLSRIKKLLKIWNGEELMKAADKNGCNALILAAVFGQTKICKFLINKLKFDINSTDRRGITALIASIERRQHTTAVYLIENGADINCSNVLGYGPLNAAAKTGQTEIMRLLLSTGVIDLNATKFLTPLQCACLAAEKEAVELLLDHGADPNATLELYSTPLTTSVRVKSLECVKLLLKAGADPNFGPHGELPLILAALGGAKTRIIECLLKAGANPNVVDPVELRTPLELAASRGYVHAVKTLFPVTPRISSIFDWSVDGVIKHVCSGKAVNQMLIYKMDYFEKAKAKGREASVRKDYLAAIEWYTRAYSINPSRVESVNILSNMSLCWAKLNQGQLALDKAQACVALDPDWPKGYYRLGVARMLQHDYSKAVEAFAKALELDPENKDTKKAHREAVVAELSAGMSRSLLS